MITFFRRALSSWIVLGLLALVMLAFIVTGVDTPGMMGGAGGGTTVAKVDGKAITGNELLRRVQNQIDGARRQQPGFDQRAFLAQGGFEGVTNALISARALEAWGRDEGFAISKRLIDAQIAGIPAFRGPTGQFDEAVMRNMLAQARISEKELRADMASDLMRNQILAPATATSPVPAGLARPYATLLLEERKGMVGIVPFAAFIDARMPTDAEVAAAYKANIATFTRPEARNLRYALFGPEQVAARAAPTEADIATFYRENAADYAARDLRTLTQVITPSEAQARSIAAAARAGTALAAAAAKAGLEASTIASQNRADFARASGEPVAAQAFAIANGMVAGPIKGAFGWYVVRVDAISGTPARSLDQVRPEIAAQLGKQKADEALADLAGKVEDAIADGASFAEIVAANKLTIVDTPALLANGQPIDNPAWKAPAELPALLKTGFEAAADDRPTIETIVPNQRYALLGVAKIIPPMPLPLAQVRDAVIRQMIAGRAEQRARLTAERIVAAVNKGVPLAKAIADSGAKLPSPQPARARQIDVARAQGSGAQVPGPVRALFTLQKNKAQLVPGDQGGVFFVTQLIEVTPGNLAAVPGLLETTRTELARAVAPELSEQFVRAVSREVEIERNPTAITATKRQLSGAQ